MICDLVFFDTFDTSEQCIFFPENLPVILKPKNFVAWSLKESRVMELFFHLLAVPICIV